MSERGILFTKENRQKARDGVKTQTRRIAKLPKVWHKGKASFENNPHGSEEFIICGDCGTRTMYCPYGRVGDLLYQLEPYQISQPSKYTKMFCGKYLDDNQPFAVSSTPEEWKKFQARKKPYARTSSRFMYKSLARTWYEITDIRVERAQEISLEDCEPEGIEYDARAGRGHMKTKFRDLWNSINKDRGHGWEKNDYVWVITYKRITK